MSKPLRLPENMPMFYPYSYTNREGKVEIGSAISKLARTILMFANTLIVSMGVLVGLALGMAIAYIGHPFFGGLFLALMVLGAWLQSTAFEYGRVYGLWRGLCPHCQGSLRIIARSSETKTVSCSICTHRVILENKAFKKVLWYA